MSMLGDFIAELLGETALSSLRGKWVARLVVTLAVLAVIGVALILIL